MVENRGTVEVMLTLITNSKGGVGKSTLATNLAIVGYDLGYRTAVIDSDDQAHAARWVAAVEPAIEIVRVVDMDEATTAVDGMEKEYELIIADTPGHDHAPDLVQTLTLLSDVALVPLQPSPADVAEIKEAFKYITLSRKLTGSPEAALVFNCTSDRDRQARRVMHEAMESRVPVANTRVRRLNAIRDATFAVAVTRMTTQKGREAGDLYRALFDELVLPCLLRKERLVQVKRGPIQEELAVNE